MADTASVARQFMDRVNGTAALWRSADIRVMAVEIDGTWHNVGTRCYLGAQKPEEVRQFETLPEVPGLLCYQQILPMAALDQAVSQVLAGALTLPSGTVIYRELPQSGTAEKPYANGATSFTLLSDLPSQSYSPWRDASYVHWSSDALLLSGTDANTLISRAERSYGDLDRMIQASMVPYDGIEGIARYFLAAPPSRVPRRPASFEVFAPYEASLDAASILLENGQLTITITAQSEPLVPRLRCGVFAWNRTGIPLSRTFDIPKDGSGLHSGWVDNHRHGVPRPICWRNVVPDYIRPMHLSSGYV